MGNLDTKTGMGGTSPANSADFENPAGENMGGFKRSGMCADFTDADIGREVTIMGWVNKIRNLGGMIFADIRDRSGLMQVVFREEKDPDLFRKAVRIRSEYVLAVCGVVMAREARAVNSGMKTGNIELMALECRILSRADTPPIYIEENLDAGEQVRLKYRYLDLRRPDMQRNIIMRHRVTKMTRDFFDGSGFLEIETPILTRSTPEGARDYLVPSRIHHGSFYALPQSPQLFKQLLMVSGMDRYYQIARCFRDEDLRADRQPEFTQVDIEMSFVEAEDVMLINEKYIKHLFGGLLGMEFSADFPRLTYHEAMTRFGSDKPDIRFGLELCDLSELVPGCGFRVFSEAVSHGGSVRCINVKGDASKFSRKEIDQLAEFVKTYGVKGLSWISLENGEIKSSLSKFLSAAETEAIFSKAGMSEGDIIFIAAGGNKVVFDSLGQLRLKIAEKTGLLTGKPAFSFVWITEFPLFEYNEGEGRWDSTHHPFTAPMDEDLHLLNTDPSKVRAKAYDIILNGNEIGGGSIRIHRQELQSVVFRLLGFTDEDAAKRFGFLLEAFRYGTPPHGGIAFGLDRMVMLMCGASSIRDVIAFPKVQNASCLMTEAPSPVDLRQLEELGISCCGTAE